ncbi:MAG: SGNH/GDSL hydrolase family protein [Lachnospiraceae bacterium]|nr:SGNH/GDSL hydrolase family protein [Lachnospiraceae bacterium]
MNKLELKKQITKTIYAIAGLFIIGLLCVPTTSEARTLESYSERPILSIVGDSISSYYTHVGWSFYGPQGAPVAVNTDESTMWWHRYASGAGLKVGRSASISGGQVTLPENEFYSMRNPNLLGILADNGEPDFIAIYGGTNDLMMGFTVNDFNNAYESLVNTLHDRYDDVKLIMIAPGYFVKGDTESNVWVNLFNDLIRNIARRHGDYFVDLRGYFEVNDYFDSDGFAIHPNYVGMIKTGSVVAATMDEKREPTGIDSVRAILDYDRYTIKVNAHDQNYDNLRFRFNLTDTTTGEVIYDTDWTSDNCFLLDEVSTEDTYTAYVEIDNNFDGAAEAASSRDFTNLQTKRTGTSVYNGVDYSPVYDFNYYVENNADLYAAFRNKPEAAIKHFVESGMREARQASESFNVWTYANNYPDLAEAFWLDTPKYYRHYIDYGRFEGRVAV